MTQFTINLVQGSVTINFTAEAARELQIELTALMQNLKTVALTTAGRGGRPQPRSSMEYRHNGAIFLDFARPAASADLRNLNI